MQDKQATPEQLSFINESIRNAGLGIDWDDFAINMLTESGKKNFSINLAKQLQQIGDISNKSSHNGMYQPILSSHRYLLLFLRQAKRQSALADLCFLIFQATQESAHHAPCQTQHRQIAQKTNSQ